MSKKKVLFVGPVLDGTGWAHAACGYIAALNKVADVVVRPTRFNSVPPNPNPLVKSLMDKPDAHPDIIIQNVLPHYFEYNAKIKRNIGLSYFETSNFKDSLWPEYCNMLDELWVPCSHNATAARESGLRKPYSVAPFSFDMSVYNRKYPEFVFKDKGKFTFYYVGEFIKRKNISAILKAFHTEFGPEEQVEIIIKTTPTGLPSDYHGYISNYIDEVKRGLKVQSNIATYHKEKVVCEYWTDEQVYSLHQSADCFVTTSFGEAWSIPAFEAMSFGKTPIVPRSTGFEAYMRNDCGWLVETTTDDCFGSVDGFKNLYTANSQWYTPKISELRKAMRAAFEGHDREVKSEAGKNRAFDFSHEAVSLELKKLLED